MSKIDDFLKKTKKSRNPFQLGKQDNKRSKDSNPLIWARPTANVQNGGATANSRRNRGSRGKGKKNADVAGKTPKVKAVVVRPPNGGHRNSNTILCRDVIGSSSVRSGRRVSFGGATGDAVREGGGITVDRQTSRIIKPGVVVAAPAPAPAGPATNTRASRGAVAASPALAPSGPARARGAI